MRVIIFFAVMGALLGAAVGQLAWDRFGPKHYITVVGEDSTEVQEAVDRLVAFPGQTISIPKNFTLVIPDTKGNEPLYFIDPEGNRIPYK